MVKGDRNDGPKEVALKSVVSHLRFSALTLDFSHEGILEEIIYKSNLHSDFFVIALLYKGSAKIKINLKEFDLEENHLLIIPADTTKEISHISQDAILKVIAYKSEFLLPLRLPDNFWEMTDYFSTKSVPVWPLKTEEVSALVPFINRMEKQKNNLEQHPFGIQILHYTFMIFLFEIAALSKHYSQPSNYRYSRKESLTIQFFSLVKKHFMQERTVKFYAQLLFITPKYLTETIKETSSKTAGEVIDDLVILEIKIQLKNSTKSISEIASGLNFSDQSIFGKFFKRNTGLSPKEFRMNS